MWDDAFIFPSSHAKHEANAVVIDSVKNRYSGHISCQNVPEYSKNHTFDIST